MCNPSQAGARTHVQTEQTSDVARPLDRHHGRFQLSIPGNTAAIAMILMLMLRLILVHPPSTIHPPQAWVESGLPHRNRSKVRGMIATRHNMQQTLFRLVMSRNKTSF
ncbi:hypothetical protein LB503_010781 [Fusarium chuoi]|nr:hypothetical protein LB503_010781 [Fusarium chuoi]